MRIYILQSEPSTIRVTLVIESRNAYLTTQAQLKHWEEQREIVAVPNLHMEDHVEIIHRNSWE